MRLKLLIADDEDMIRRGVAKYIELHSNRFSKIYEAENGQKAIELILKHRPDILLLDIQMPLKNGIDVMQEAEKAGIKPLTIVLSGYDEFKYAQRALRYGAKEYLLKPVRAADILACVNRIADTFFVPEAPAEDGGAQEQKNRLVTAAQEYVAEHYMENLSLADVAEKVGISSGYLSTMFSQNLSMGFVDYLNQVRIERACSYLEQGYWKTYEIAYKVGFRDEKYFSRVFKRIKGISPKEYRAAAGK